MRFLVIVALLLVARPARAACLVLTGGTVHTPDGPREDVAIVVDGTRVAGVGTRVEGLAGDTWRGRRCDLRALQGAHVTPGFIEVGGQLGLVEIELERATQHQSGDGDPIRAAMRVADAYNPLSSLVPIQRTGGITGAVVSPSGGTVSGQGAFVVLAGARQEEAVVEPSVSMVARLGSGSRAETLLGLRELLADADAWRRNRAAWERNQLRSLLPGAGPLDLQAMADVLEGRIPLVVDADRAADIEALLRLKAEAGIRMVITGAAEGWMLASALAAANVPVVLDPLVYGPGTFDQIHARPDNAAILVAAGVEVVLSTFSDHNARNLRQVAGNAVREGLAHASALRAVTAAPADAFGLLDRGRIAPGAVADLVVWTGDPLELSSHVTQVWIGGVEQSNTNRQMELREAYRQVP